MRWASSYVAPWAVEEPRGQCREDGHCPRPHVALLDSRTTGVLQAYYLQDRTLRFSGLSAASPYTRSGVSPAAGGGSSLYKTALSSTLYKTALSTRQPSLLDSIRQLSVLYSTRQLSLLYYPLQDSSIFSLLLSIRHLYNISTTFYTTLYKTPFLSFYLTIQDRYLFSLLPFEECSLFSLLPSAIRSLYYILQYSSLYFTLSSLYYPLQDSRLFSLLPSTRQILHLSTTLYKTDLSSIYYPIINRPGVAGAVLQTASLLIKSFILFLQIFRTS